MNSPLTVAATDALRAVSLEDKYTLEKGRVYISGTQALARLPMLQKERDRLAGLNTAGYISGYRGSPLGGLDMALWKAKKHLASHDVVFMPGLNEDLAATAVWGTQQVNLYQNAQVDGVFGMWYGKGPGVDRSADVLKHANAAGTSKHGGVLMLAGDDHAAKSSSVAHQSEHLLIACGIPVLYPSNVQEYLDYGIHAWAMSRYSGLWVSMKCVTDVVESTASVDMDPERVQVVLPEDFEVPKGGLNIRWPDPPLDQEARMLDHKWYAALAYIRANRLNRVVIDSPKARFGIMAAGKAYLDVRQALTDLGLDDETCQQIGIRVFKVGCVWPLDAHDARDFATGLEEILVVEEKRQILEYALKEELYNWRDDVRPRIYGKFDERDNAGGEWSQPRGQWLLPARYELSPALIAKAIASRLERVGLPEDVRARVLYRIAIIEAKEREAARPRLTVERKPWFCSGCPHNTSTRVPEGSRALAGIGCHYMAMWMDRRTETFTQMGGEGVSWLGQMHFSGDKHVFVNLGDGTYFHSGLLAIRAAVAGKANITYKILFNDAVAMTGGQPVDGILTVPQIARQLAAEGTSKVLIVTDEPAKFASREGLPAEVAVHHRDEFDHLQKALRDTAGVTILIYDQTCATEKRRRRKRGEYPDPARRVFINEEVCEGCGDCSTASNCLSVEPLETPLGTKRKINQSSCNKDFSCLKGFCPSFVTAEGAQLKKAAGGRDPNAALAGFTLPEPTLPVLKRPFWHRRHRCWRHRRRHRRGAAGHGRPPGKQGRHGARHDRPGPEGWGGAEPRADRQRARRYPRHPHCYRRGTTADRLRRHCLGLVRSPVKDAPRRNQGCGEQCPHTDRRVHRQSGLEVSDAFHRVGCAQQRRRGMRVSRCQRVGAGIFGRHPLRQPVDARFCLAEGLGAGVPRGAAQGYRAQWRGGGQEPPGLRVWPRGRPRHAGAERPAVLRRQGTAWPGARTA